MIPLEDPTTLSLLFHLNSEPWLNDEAYKSGAANQEFKRPEGILAETALPEVQNSLSELFRKRRSCRAFSCETMPLTQVAALLAAAYGIVEIAAFGDQGKFLRRSVPSAGGLFPLEVYASRQGYVQLYSIEAKKVIYLSSCQHKNLDSLYRCIDTRTGFTHSNCSP